MLLLRRVKAIVAIPEVDQVYDGVVKSIMPFGAFVEFMPGKDGLLHISEIKWERLETMDGVLEVGEASESETCGSRQENRQIPSITQSVDSQTPK
jgi:polyribonucleotide nucleotidyltransferase